MKPLIFSLLSAIRTGSIGGRSKICLKSSNLVFQVLEILYKAGYISYYRKIYPGTKVEIGLRYSNTARPYVKKIITFSSSGYRRYYTALELRNKFRLNDFILISTPNGLITMEDVWKYNIGGEILFLLKV